MRDFLWAVGTLATLFTVGAWITAIWLVDQRWGQTGLVTFFVAFGVFAVSSFMKAQVRHADKCGGC